MLRYIDKIKEISKRLLEEGQVEMIIGFRKGTISMMNEPHFARSPEAVKHFVWDSNCGINLCNYLTNRTEKIGILAKGCDSRNIVRLHPSIRGQTARAHAGGARRSALCRR